MLLVKIQQSKFKSFTLIGVELFISHIKIKSFKLTYWIGCSHTNNSEIVESVNPVDYAVASVGSVDRTCVDASALEVSKFSACSMLNSVCWPVKLEAGYTFDSLSTK